MSDVQIVGQECGYFSGDVLCDPCFAKSRFFMR